MSLTVTCDVNGSSFLASIVVPDGFSWRSAGDALAELEQQLDIAKEHVRIKRMELLGVVPIDVG